VRVARSFFTGFEPEQILRFPGRENSAVVRTARTRVNARSVNFGYAREVVPVALIKNTSRSVQRQVDLTTAVCQERLLATHVRHVLALVDLVADRLAFDEALDIYVRVLRLTPEQARNVGSRALAELGRRDADALQRATAQSTAATDREADDEPVQEAKEGTPRSDALFSRMRRRVRGRVQEELRERINLAAARTEDDLLETHVENSLIFVRALGNNDTPAPDAVELYLETMMLPEGTADVIYHRALRTIADRVLPPLPSITDNGPAADTTVPTSEPVAGA
jgi:hypothetical protein